MADAEHPDSFQSSEPLKCAKGIVFSMLAEVYLLAEEFIKC